MPAMLGVKVGLFPETEVNSRDVNLISITSVIDGRRSMPKLRSTPDIDVDVFPSTRSVREVPVIDKEALL